MASADLSAGLNYLTDAAHLLRNVAPETSAHLMSQRNKLLYHHDIVQSEIQRQHVCTACGHIMVPGQGIELKLETQKTTKRKRTRPDKKKMPAAATGPRKVLSCGFCDRVTRIGLPAPEPITRRKAAKPRSHKNMDTIETRGTTTANSSSKKRAKNRKTGLQALISGQQNRQSNPLSLADFMMK